jgi:hypothetical protein
LQTRVKKGVAFLFRRAGVEELGEDEFVRQASLDLHWFSPKDGRRFLDASKALGFLAAGSAAGRVRPTFDPAAVDVPLDFRLDGSALDAAPAAAPGSVADELVAAAAAKRGEAPETVWGDVRRKAEAKLLAEPVAAALVAAEAGVDVLPFMGRVNAALAAARPASPSSS